MNTKKFLLVASGVAIIVVAAAVAYYFSVSLPRSNAQQLTDQETAQCATQAQNVFENETKSGVYSSGSTYVRSPGDYSDYYNPVMHRCFVSFTYNEVDGGNMGVAVKSENFDFYDVWNNVRIAGCGTFTPASNDLLTCINYLATSTVAAETFSQSQYSDLINQYTNGQINGQAQVPPFVP